MPKDTKFGCSVSIDGPVPDNPGRVRVYALVVERGVGPDGGDIKLSPAEYSLTWHWRDAALVAEEHAPHATFQIDAHHDSALVWASATVKGQTVTSEHVLIRKTETPGHAGQREHSAPIHATRVQLTRTAQASTNDLVLWAVIRESTERIKFPHYSRFLDYVLFGDDEALHGHRQGRMDAQSESTRQAYDGMRDILHKRTHGGRSLTGTDAYQALRDATDWFLKVNVGVLPSPAAFERVNADLQATVGTGLTAHSLQEAWNAYTVRVNGAQLLPYMNIIRDKLTDGELHDRDGRRSAAIVQCSGLLRDKLEAPCFLELIWSYWQEEGMLVQTVNAIAQRFQNRRVGRDRDPLANLEIDPLRPLNNLLWGYVQDELQRLSVRRRAHEYEHQYGLRLEGRAVVGFRPADRRSKFIEGFHNFLQVCNIFFERDDQTTVLADGFPVLNAIKELHYLLAAGAHNQYGDLPSTARAEMLVQQWLLGRPEMREFLGGRVMVPYPEKWMDRVDAMKTLQGWTDTSVVHFNDLATFGEQILLGLRFGFWSGITEPAHAANYCRAFRAEIQGYIHAYRAVTGVDLGAPVRTGQAAAERNLPPSVHLLRRYVAAKRA